MRTLPGYQLEHRLGEGSAGTVWRARQAASLDRPVALKRLRAAGGGAAAEQLRVEAEALACLDHPHIVRIFEIVADGDGVAIAMQLAGGGSLDERLRRRGPLPPAEVVDVAAKLAAALASAHRRGVLHRDVKPANVLFTLDGEPLLSDFGICSPAAAPDPVIRGTEAYLDPTVRVGRPADAAADVFALGAVTYEMLVGAPPASPAVPLAEAAPGVAPELARVVERALAPEPGARFPSAAELAVALRAAAPAAAPSPVPPGASGAPVPNGAAAAPGRPGNAGAPVPPAPAGAPTPPGLGPGAGPTGPGTFPAPPPAAAAVTHPGPDRQTRTFGPRPPRAAPAAGGRHRRLAAAAGLAVAVLAAGAALAWPRPGPATGGAAAPVPPPAPRCGAPASPPAGPGGEVLEGDLDGDGCPDAVVRTGNTLERLGADGRTERFVLGAEGDLALLGDWDCDGVVTPGVSRAATGEAFHFDGWARPGEALPAATRVPASSPRPPSC